MSKREQFNILLDDCEAEMVKQIAHDAEVKVSVVLEFALMEMLSLVDVTEINPIDHNRTTKKRDDMARATEIEKKGRYNPICNFEMEKNYKSLSSLIRTDEDREAFVLTYIFLTSVYDNQDDFIKMFKKIFNNTRKTIRISKSDRENIYLDYLNYENEFSDENKTSFNESDYDTKYNKLIDSIRLFSVTKEDKRKR